MVRATKLGHLCEWRWAEPRTREHLENRNHVSLDFHPPLHSSTSFPHLCKGVSTWSRCEFLLNKSCRVENKWKNYLFSNLWKTMLKAGRTFYFTPLSRVKEDGLIRGRRRGLEDQTDHRARLLNVPLCHHGWTGTVWRMADIHEPFQPRCSVLIFHSF